MQSVFRWARPIHRRIAKFPQERHNGAMADGQRGWKKSWVQAEKMIELGLTLPIATVLGWLIGNALDKKLHTTWIGIVGLLFGAAAGLTRFIRGAMAIGGEDANKDDGSSK
jgi:F0F1-type ATP synthase assembly protein I